MFLTKKVELWWKLSLMKRSYMDCVYLLKSDLRLRFETNEILTTCLTCTNWCQTVHNFLTFSWFRNPSEAIETQLTSIVIKVLLVSVGWSLNTFSNIVLRYGWILYLTGFLVVTCTLLDHFRLQGSAILSVASLSKHGGLLYQVHSSSVQLS